MPMAISIDHNRKTLPSVGWSVGARGAQFSTLANIGGPFVACGSERRSVTAACIIECHVGLAANPNGEIRGQVMIGS